MKVKLLEVCIMKRKSLPESWSHTCVVEREVATLSVLLQSNFFQMYKQRYWLKMPWACRLWGLCTRQVSLFDSKESYISEGFAPAVKTTPTVVLQQSFVALRSGQPFSGRTSKLLNVVCILHQLSQCCRSWYMTSMFDTVLAFNIYYSVQTFMWLREDQLLIIRLQKCM